MSKPKFATIPIDQLELGPNIRDVAQDIDDLVESIREHGVLQAITVWPNEAGTASLHRGAHRRPHRDGVQGPGPAGRT